MREAIDPLASVGTSNVFFQVVLGRNTPKEISSALETQPPSVVEHLHKLQDMGVVELGEKEGKYQRYQINWKKFVDEFFDHIYTPRLQEAVLRSGEKEEFRKEVEGEQKMLKEVMGELKRNERFRGILRNYFERLVGDMERGLYPQRTIWGAIYCFEDSLSSVPSMGRKTKNPELTELLTLLEKWNRCTQRFKGHGPRAAFDRSIGAA